MQRRALTWICCGLLLACGGEAESPLVDATTDADDTMADIVEVPLEPLSLWSEGDAPMAWADWVSARPWLTDVSTWAHREEVVEGPLVHRHLPDFGVGNGHVFSLIGYGRPINTLHSMNGPHYHKGTGFFGDVAVAVRRADGAATSWDSEWAGWVRGAPVVHTQALDETVSLSTTDFAPLVGSVDDPRRRALIRVVVIGNRSESTLEGLDLAVTTTRVQDVEGETLVEARDDRTRVISAVEEPDAAVVDGELMVPLGALESGAERVVVLAFSFGEVPVAWTVAEVDAQLEETVAAWHARTAEATVLVTPDERVNDYLEGQRTVVLVQQAYNGSSHPMSEYTGAWLRDQAGPVRLLLRLGMSESAREMLDYLWLAALAQGQILNDNFGNFQPEDAQPEPDWAAGPVMDGRERAESPSYVPLMYRWYWRTTGQGDFLSERLAMMRACLDKQDLRDDLLPFSTDETFRTAMAAAHGHAVFEQFADNYLSANSSFLWVAAAEGMAEMATALLGEEGTAVAAHYTARAAEVRAAAEATYLSEQGHYHPYVTEDTGTPAPAPFEDVNTKPIWSGYFDAMDPAATDQLSAVIETLDGEDGVLVSPLPEDFEPVLDHPMEDGIYTGMSPGYFLSNLAVTHHPLAESAFNALALHATVSGTTPEYHILDDYRPLHPVYDPVGGTGDYTARFRPWEGGIVADAALEYLLGNACDAVAGELRLAPNLPNGWPWMEAHRVRCGDSRVDVRVDRAPQGWTVNLTHRDGPPVAVVLTVPLMGGVTLDGVTWEAASIPLAWGNEIRRLSAITLAETQTAEVVVGH